jgi:hypothetical protein
MSIFDFIFPKNSDTGDKYRGIDAEQIQGISPNTLLLFYAAETLQEEQMIIDEIRTQGRFRGKERLCPSTLEGLRQLKAVQKKVRHP